MTRREVKKGTFEEEEGWNVQKEDTGIGKKRNVQGINTER